MACTTNHTEAKLLPPSVHKFAMDLMMTENEKEIQKIERFATFSEKYQNATWSVQFVITSAGTGGVINFTTDPDHVLRETHRIVCSILNDAHEARVITLGGVPGALCKQLGFFNWYDIKDFQAWDNVKICFLIINVCTNESAVTPGISDLKMLAYFESGARSDIVIKTAKKEFKAHKLVLAARSPVFEAMLESDMQVATTGKITIDNLETKVLEEMLRYMYSKVSTKLSEMPCQLFVAAHMYKVQDLQKLCVDHLLHHVRVDNFVEILELCDMYVLENVREEVLNFIDNNKALVMKEKKYQVYLKKKISGDLDNLRLESY